MWSTIAQQDSADADECALTFSMLPECTGSTESKCHQPTHSLQGALAIKACTAVLAPQTMLMYKSWSDLTQPGGSGQVNGLNPS